MPLDDFQVGRLLRVGDGLPQEAGITEDHAQRVVDLMGQPGGQLAHGGHLFRLPDLLLHALLPGCLPQIDHHLTGRSLAAAHRIEKKGVGAAIGQSDLALGRNDAGDDFPHGAAGVGEIEEERQDVAVGALAAGQFDGQVSCRLIGSEHGAAAIHQHQRIADALDDGRKDVHLPKQAVNGRQVLGRDPQLPAQRLEHAAVVPGSFLFRCPVEDQQPLGVAGARLHGHEQTATRGNAGPAGENGDKGVGQVRGKIGLRPGERASASHGAGVGDATGPETLADCRQRLLPELGPRSAAVHILEQADKEPHVGPPGLYLAAEGVGAFLDHPQQVLGVMLQLPPGLEQVLAHPLHGVHQLLDLVALLEPVKQGRAFDVGDVAPENRVQPLEVIDHQHPEEQIGSEKDQQHRQGKKGKIGEDGSLDPSDAAAHRNADEIDAGDAALLLAETAAAVSFEQFGRRIFGAAVAVHTLLREPHRPDHEIVLFLAELFLPLPQFLARMLAEITDQLPFERIGLVFRVAGVLGHPPVHGAGVGFADRGHDLARDVRTGHGLDDEGVGQPFIHGRPQDVPDIVLDGVGLHEDQPGLVPHLFLEDTAHVKIKTQRERQAKEQGNDHQAGEELGLDLLRFG